MSNSINPNIRPCDDFYDYICDGFRKSEALELIAGMDGKISHYHRLAKEARNLMIGTFKLTNKCTFGLTRAYCKIHRWGIRS